MAMRTEMYTPVGGNLVIQQPQQQAGGPVTWWDRLMNAARIQFGPDIQLQSASATRNELTQFVDDLLLKVLHSDPEPTMIRSTIIDITYKEFVNLGERENDESIIRVGKNAPIAIGTRYHFIMTGNTIQFDSKYNFGAQIVALSMTGGYLSVGGTYSSIKDQAYNQALTFNYHQEEKVIVPPKTKVKAKIVTSTKKHQQHYTLEFSTPRSRCVRVTYLTRAQQQLNVCSCCQPSVGYVYAADLMRNLPNFKDSNGYCSFTQDGTLTWIGEACSVEKSEQPVASTL